MARRALHVLTLTAAAGAAVATTNRDAESDWGDAGEDVQPRSFEVHNPTGATVTEIHLVQSAHFDGGCKTFGCSARLVAGEPDRCAQHHAEPFAYHIVNRWLDQFFLDAVALSNATRNGSGLPRYRHMVQPWLLALLFDLKLARRPPSSETLLFRFGPPAACIVAAGRFWRARAVGSTSDDGGTG